MRIPIEDDGEAGEPMPLVDLSSSQPDGVALAEDGTMFVGCYRPIVCTASRRTAW